MNLRKDTVVFLASPNMALLANLAKLVGNWRQMKKSRLKYLPFQCKNQNSVSFVYNVLESFQLRTSKEMTQFLKSWASEFVCREK